MDKSSRLDIPIDAQRAAWNQWNTETARERALGEPSSRQVALAGHTLVVRARKRRPGA